MKKLVALTLILAVMLTVSGCGKKESTDLPNTNETIGDIDINTESETETETEKETETETESETEGNSSFSGFGNIGLNVPDLSDIPTYEAPKDNVIDFKFEEFKLDIEDNFYEADMAKIDDMTEDELKLIATTKSNLLANLTAAFKNAGINIDINEKSGEVSLDSSVLFGGDSAVPSDDGKAFLKKFIKTYSSVVLDDEFDGFIKKILVEGHTAPIAGSTYESGLALSEQRADNVKNYCLSTETGISSDEITALTSTLEAVGMSNSKPVKDASGNVDVAASRRVAFRFLINLDK